jgi:hypothetical protein
MLNQQNLNKLHDFTFAFLEVEMSKHRLDKFSTHCVGNSNLNSVRSEYTILNPWKSVQSVSSVFK